MNFKVFCHLQLAAFLSPWMGLWCKDRLRDDCHLFIATFVHQFLSRQEGRFQVHLAQPEQSGVVYYADLEGSCLQEMPVFGLFIKVGQSRWHKGFYWKTPEYPQVTDKIILSWAVTVFSGGFYPCCGPWSPHQTGNLPQTDFADLGINEFVGCINLHAGHNVTTVWPPEQEIILIVGRRRPISYILFQHYVNRNKLNSLQRKTVTDSQQLLTAVNNISLLVCLL